MNRIKIIGQNPEPGRRKRFFSWLIVYGLVFLGIGASIVKIGNNLVTRSVPVGSIKISVSKQHYKQGQTVAFTITNNFDSVVYVNNTCPQEPLTVYKWTGKLWQRIHDTARQSLCKGQARQIAVAPKGKTSGDYGPWPNLFKDPGLYRLVVAIDNYNALPYADFEVMKPQPTSTVIKPVAGSSSTQNQTRQTGGNTSSKTGGSTTRQSRTITSQGGSINIQYDNGHIYIISVSPAAGYSFEQSGSGTSTIEVNFQRPGREAQVQAHVSNGTLTINSGNDD